MELKEVFARRKSVRSYTGEPITDEQLEIILAAAKAAPVAMAQFDSMHLTVITNAELLASIERAGGEMFGDPSRKMLYGAPTLVLVSAKIPDASRENSMHSSAAMVVHNMALQATELGVGSVDIWGTIAAASQKPELVAAMQLPEGFVPCCGIALGQTAEELPVRDIPADKIAVSTIA